MLLFDKSDNLNTFVQRGVQQLLDINFKYIGNL